MGGKKKELWLYEKGKSGGRARSWSRSNSALWLELVGTSGQSRNRIQGKSSRRGQMGKRKAGKVSEIGGEEQRVPRLRSVEEHEKFENIVHAKRLNQVRPGGSSKKKKDRRT